MHMAERDAGAVDAREKLNRAFSDRLDKLKELILSYGFSYEEAGIFGSYARGEHKALSDIDICVIGERPNRFITASLREEAEELGADIIFVTRDYFDSGQDLLSRNLRRDYRRIL